MVFLEIVPILDRRDRSFQHETADDRIVCRLPVLFCGNGGDAVYFWQGGTVWRSGTGMAVHGLRDHISWRGAAFLSWHYRDVSVQDVSGGQKKTDLSGA